MDDNLNGCDETGQNDTCSNPRRKEHEPTSVGATDLEALEREIRAMNNIEFVGPKLDEEAIELALSSARARISKIGTVRRRNPRVTRTITRILPLTAALGILLGIFFWSKAGRYHSVRTDYGEWKTVELPDGSVVRLHANSKLTYRANWDDGAARTVWFEGEAFFDIRGISEVGRAFVVRTNDLDVSVLGTSFNVATRDERTEVYLEEGEIKLELGSAVMLMQPGDIIAYSASSDELVDRRRAVDPATAPSSWNDGVLELVNVTAFEIFKEVKEIYGREIVVVRESVYDVKYTVRLPMQDLEVVIPILESTMEIEIAVDRDKLLIK